MTDKEKELYIKYCKYDKDPKEIILNLVGLIEKKDKIKVASEVKETTQIRVN